MPSSNLRTVSLIKCRLLLRWTNDIEWEKPTCVSFRGQLTSDHFSQLSQIQSLSSQSQVIQIIQFPCSICSFVPQPQPVQQQDIWSWVLLASQLLRQHLACGHDAKKKILEHGFKDCASFSTSGKFGSWINLVLDFCNYCNYDFWAPWQSSTGMTLSDNGKEKPWFRSSLRLMLTPRKEI